MARLPRVRQAANFPTQGATFTPVSSGAADFFAGAANAITPYAEQELQKQEARVQQQLDLDFMRAAADYETGLSNIEMPAGGTGYSQQAQEVFNNTFGSLSENVPDDLRPTVEGRVEELGIRFDASARQQEDAEAASYSRDQLQDGLDMIEAEAARNPQAAQGLVARAQSMINNNPDLSPDEKRDLNRVIEQNLTVRSEVARVQSDPAARSAYADGGANVGAFKDSMARTESGGNYGAQNDEGFVGKYQFGQARLSEFYAATNTPPRSMEEFRRDPQLQEAAMDWHIADIDSFIVDNGLDRFIGQEVGGVVITQNGMRAMAHLGGKGGLRQFLESGGQYNPEDSNGTSLSDYAATHGSAVGLTAESYELVSRAATVSQQQVVERQAAQNQILSAELGVAVSRNEATYTDLNQALESGVISAQRWETLTEQLDKARTEQAETADIAAAFAERVQDGQANVYAADDRKATDMLDETVVNRAEAQQIDIDQARMAVVEQTGIAPRGWIDDLRNRISQNDADALDTAARVMQVAPNAFDRDGGSQIQQAVEGYNAYVRAGYSRDEAAKNVNPSESAKQREEVTRSAVNAELRELSADDVLDEFSTWIPFDRELDINPALEANLMGDFELIYRTARRDGLPPDVAKEYTIERLIDPVNGVYGPSSVARGTGEGLIRDARTQDGLMRHPPERMYPDIGGHDYLGENIIETLGTIGGYDGGDWFLLPDDVETESYARAAREGQIQEYPAYQLHYTDDRGIPQMVLWYMPATEVLEKTVEHRDQRRAELAAQTEQINRDRAMAEERLNAPLSPVFQNMQGTGVNLDTIPRPAN